MPLPEGHRPRRGDVLILHGLVKHNVDDGEDDVHLEIADTYRVAVLGLDKIIGIAQFHFDVGEIVRLKNSGDLDFRVVAIFGEFAWVQALGRAPQTAPLDALVLAPVQKPQPENPNDDE